MGSGGFSVGTDSDSLIKSTDSEELPQGYFEGNPRARGAGQIGDSIVSRHPAYKPQGRELSLGVCHGELPGTNAVEWLYPPGRSM